MDVSLLKKKLFHEVKVYYINVLYLFLFFGMFTWYRRLVLAQYYISYLNYGISLIEALVLGKIIMIGDALHLARGLGDRPLIIPTMYKTLLFSLWVLLFKMCERLAGDLIDGLSLAESVAKLGGDEKYEILAGSLVVSSAFIPFFAFKELGRVLGRRTLARLFFRRREEMVLVIPARGEGKNDPTASGVHPGRQEAE